MGAGIYEPLGSTSTVVPWKLRIQALVNFLMQFDDRRVRFNLGTDSDSKFSNHPSLCHMKLWEKATELRLAPFSAEILQVIATTYSDWKPGSCRLGTKFDRQKFLSGVEQVWTLRKTLDRTINDFERQALVEDIAGKILLICWHGVTSEIVQVLREVADQYVKQGKQKVSTFGRVFREVTNYVPDHGPVSPLQQMMNDAAHGISKHQLSLNKQAEWLGATQDSRVPWDMFIPLIPRTFG
ncbi:hypothetical protein F5J12DRAFT_860559 [Pisolithus orientalis]|uniref:uncharacterized protein n=1 Tax=Pisolithus orientalis TaxID=936130 RepID=UPI002225751E|nr:uncharacterized protein F5J12DRAFT_860559 [Pisolithus orientalis]KAI5992318.1 hypothetical protein F5J12DRAFT_860559 [Pisolithus orientalis]